MNVYDFYASTNYQILIYLGWVILNKQDIENKKNVCNINRSMYMKIHIWK